MPQIGNVNLAIGDFLATPAGLARPAAELLREVRESIAASSICRPPTSNA